MHFLGPKRTKIGSKFRFSKRLARKNGKTAPDPGANFEDPTGQKLHDQEVLDFNEQVPTLLDSSQNSISHLANLSKFNN